MLIKLPFRQHHLFSILTAFDKSTAPLDIFLRKYFISHKAIGSKDRQAICEDLYDLIRWRCLLDYFCAKPSSWQDRYALYKKYPLTELSSKENIPPHIRVSFPKWIFERIEKAYGTEKAINLCLASNGTAPITIRANTLKTSRDNLLALLKDSYQVEPTPLSPWGIRFLKRENLFGMEIFKEGLFEMQDEGSQLVAMHVNAMPGQLVLDYCSGAGGKTLAFAPLMEKTGQIYLHDIRPFALQDAKKRLRRAGIQNFQILEEHSSYKPKLKEKMHRVLVDAPCGGSGTWRRNPDMKWKFTEEMLKRLIEEQRKIFAEALSYLHPKGHIIYATCSLLPEENQEQISYFKETFSLEEVSPPFQSLPEPGAMDGLFASVLKRK